MKWWKRQRQSELGHVNLSGCCWCLSPLLSACLSYLPSHSVLFILSLSLTFFFFKNIFYVRKYKTAGSLGCQTCQYMLSYYMAQDYALDIARGN